MQVESKDIRYKNLTLKDLNPNPFEQFESWFSNAKKKIELYPDAVALSTIDEKGYPSSRNVLLRGFLPPYFQFFTNYNSEKGQDLLKNPKASLLFYWKELGQQIRIWGDVTKASELESDNYWQTRPLESRIHSLASNQSSEVKDFNEFLNQIKKLEKEYETKKLLRPKNWGGFNLKANKFEFWQEGEFRLHHRFVYKTTNSTDWNIKQLYP